jgi:predicted transposase YdaD
MTEPEAQGPHDVHDRGYKLLLSFSKMFQQLIEGYVDADWKSRLDYSRSQRLDKTFILKGLEKQESDVLYQVPLRGEPGKEVYLYVLIEHQSTVDYSLAFRILVLTRAKACQTPPQPSGR